MAEVVRSLPNTWETQIEFEAPGCYQHLGNEPVARRFSLSQ